MPPTGFGETKEGTSYLLYVRRIFEQTDRTIGLRQDSRWKLALAFIGLVALWLWIYWAPEDAHHNISLDDVFAQYERNSRGQLFVHDSDLDSDFALQGSSSAVEEDAAVPPPALPSPAVPPASTPLDVSPPAVPRPASPPVSPSAPPFPKLVGELHRLTPLPTSNAENHGTAPLKVQTAVSAFAPSASNPSSAKVSSASADSSADIASPAPPSSAAFEVSSDAKLFEILDRVHEDSAAFSVPYQFVNRSDGSAIVTDGDRRPQQKGDATSFNKADANKGGGKQATRVAIPVRAGGTPDGEERMPSAISTAMARPRGLTSACAPGCTEHGTCNEELGRCDCPLGQTGDDCSQVRSLRDFAFFKVIYDVNVPSFPK
jgi:hypothetical protein